MRASQARQGVAVAVAFAAVAAGGTGTRSAAAQGPAQLPALPAPPGEALPSSPAPPQAPPNGDATLTASTPPPPPPVVYVEPPHGSESLSIEHEHGAPIHAPRNALWLGARLGALAYGGGLYINDLNVGSAETVGNFIKPGAAVELDIGARLAHHYIPYLAVEFSMAGAGRRFDGTGAHASTEYAGIGFRYVAGDVNSVAFVSELSFGFRRFRASNDTGTWSITGFEPFRIGLGAEIRLTNRFTISPLVSLAEGTLTDTGGNIAFAPNQGDGLSGPPYAGNSTVPSFAQTNYFAFVFGCGAHFDFFGD